MGPNISVRLRQVQKDEEVGVLVGGQKAPISVPHGLKGLFTAAVPSAAGLTEGANKGKAPRLREKAESGERVDGSSSGSLAAIQAVRSCPDPLGSICEEPDLDSDGLLPLPLSRDERGRCAGEVEGGLLEVRSPTGDKLCWVCFLGTGRG